MLTHISQAGSIRQLMFYKIARCLRKQHLLTMPRTHNACREMNIHPHIAFGDQQWLTRVESHTHSHNHPLRPEVRSVQGALGIYCCRYSVRGASEGLEEGIPLRIDFVTVPFLKCSPQQAPAFGEYKGIAITQLL